MKAHREKIVLIVLCLFSISIMQAMEVREKSPRKPKGKGTAVVHATTSHTSPRQHRVAHPHNQSNNRAVHSQIPPKKVTIEDDELTESATGAVKGKRSGIERIIPPLNLNKRSNESSFKGSHKGNTSKGTGRSSVHGGKNDKRINMQELRKDRVEDKVNPVTPEDLLLLVKQRSRNLQGLIDKGAGGVTRGGGIGSPHRRIRSPRLDAVVEGEEVEETEEADDPLAEITFQSSQEYNMAKEQRKEAAKELAKDIHVSPAVLVACHNHLRGQKDPTKQGDSQQASTPREFEEKMWEEVKENRPDKYQEVVLNTFEKILKRMEQLDNPQYSQNSESPGEEGSEEPKGHKYKDTHIGILNDHIGKQEEDILRQQRAIQRKEWVNRIANGLWALLSAALTVWATVATTTGDCTCPALNATMGAA